MPGEVKLSYQEMRANCNKLAAHAETLETIRSEADNIVKSFTGVWMGQAQQVFEEDYMLIFTSLTKAIETMTSITTTVQNYVNDMEEVESAYGSGPHVTIG